MVNHILLSYPRCGKSYLSHCIQQISEGIKFDSLAHREPGAFLTRTHIAASIPNDTSASLILLLRNYKECVPRHGASLPDGACAQGNYWKNIMVFHKYPHKKMLLYYEDLITTPFATILNLATFLDLPQSNVMEFFDNFEQHRQDSLSNYTGSVTRGDKLLHHSLVIEEDLQREHDESLRARNEQVYDLYLKRYQV